MKIRVFAAACAASFLVAGCGGGSSGGTPPAPAIATLNVTLAPSVTSHTVSDVDSAATFTIDASYTGSTSDPVYPSLSLDGSLLSQVGDIVKNGNIYTARINARGDLSAGRRSTTVTFRLCRDSGCGTVYPGSEKSFTYTLDVAIAPWTTLQRNAAHNGLVRATFDPAVFAKAWEYAPPGVTRFQPVSANMGSVFATQTNGDGSTSLVAIDGNAGTPRWNYSLGTRSYVGGPALTGERVMASSMYSSSSNNPLTVLNATNGQFVTNLIFASQWSNFAQPTPWDNELYMAAGYYGNVVYGYDLVAGRERWTANGSAGRTWDGSTPAVDQRYVYYYSGALDVFDRATGARVVSIPDPFWQWNGYSYQGGPILGSANNVVAYSGNGMGTYSLSFPLVNYDVDGARVRWRTASAYSNVPALANGTLYAGSNQTRQFDAISEATGAVLWSWPLPDGEQFVGNVIITDTLAFVSTNARVYAIELAGSHGTRWSAPTGGWLAITPDAKLVVVPAGPAPGVRMVA